MYLLQPTRCYVKDLSSLSVAVYSQSYSLCSSLVQMKQKTLSIICKLSNFLFLLVQICVCFISCVFSFNIKKIDLCNSQSSYIPEPNLAFILSDIKCDSHFPNPKKNEGLLQSDFVRIVHLFFLDKELDHCCFFLSVFSNFPLKLFAPVVALTNMLFHHSFTKGSSSKASNNRQSRHLTRRSENVTFS